MYIEPNTVIKIYKGIPLDNTYEHTLYFDSLSAQTNYFHSTASSKIIQTFLRNTYQRVNKGRMRVQATADSLYTANYMAFQNTAYGNKWFYAFVTSVEYVNDVTTEIEFEIDVMQTYAFNYTLGTVFVEREHSVTDAIGDNIIEENLATGDYVTTLETRNLMESQYTDEDAQGLTAIFVLNNDVFHMDAGLQFQEYSGVIASLKFYRVNIENVYQDLMVRGDARLNAFYNTLVNRNAMNALISIYTVPSWIVKECSVETWQSLTDTYLPEIQSSYNYQTQYEKELTLSGYNRQFFGTYLPKNKKLYTYPYRVLEISNNIGANQLYRFEFFDGIPTFKVLGNIGINGKAYIFPKSYNNETNVSDLAVSTDGWSQGCVNFPNYVTWLASEKISFMSKQVQNLVTTVGHTASGFLLGQSMFSSSAGGYSAMIQGSVNNVNNNVDFLLSGEKAKIAPTSSIGNGCGDLQTANHTIDFTVRTRSITEQYARSIDDYFTKFGYATKRLKQPNINARPHWNYVKTIGMELNNNECPTDDARKICAIYDKGVTFWKNASEVGDYSLDNSPQ